MKGLRVLWRPRVTWAHLQEAPNLINKVKIDIFRVKIIFFLDEIRVEAAEGPTRSRRTSVMSDSDYQANDAVESAFKRALKKAAPNMEMVEEEQSESSFAGSHRSEVRDHNFILNFKNLFFSNRNNHQCNRPMQHQPFLQCQVFLEFQKLQKHLLIYQVKINRAWCIQKWPVAWVGFMFYFRNNNVVNSINCFWKISCYWYHNSFWEINKYNFNNIWCINNSGMFLPTQNLFSPTL